MNRLLPYKTFTYYADYLETINLIILQRNRAQLVKIYFIHLIILFTVLNILYSQYHFSPPGNDSDYNHFRHANIIYYAFWSDFQWVFTGLALITCYMIQTIYVWPPVPFVHFCEGAFLSKDKEINIRHLAVQIVNSIQIFTVIVNAFFIYLHLIFFQQAIKYRHRLFCSISGIFDMFFHVINSIMLDATIIAFADVSIRVGAQAQSLLAHLFLLFNQNVNRLKAALALNKAQWNWTPLDAFLRNDIRNFQSLAHFDTVFGHNLAAFLAINFPLNAYLLMVAGLGRLPANRPIIQLVVWGLIAEQGLCNFAFHLIYANFSSRVAHRSAKSILLPIAARQQHRMGHFRSKLHLTLTINRLHTRNRYGINYGSFGLVTMETFTRVN